MVPRTALLDLIGASIERHPVTALLGPRQCGKTTLARILEEKMSSHYFNLEDPADRARLGEAPLINLENLAGLVILDEIQSMPDLFRVLKLLADRKEREMKFLILGSASPSLVKNSSETLAGRISFVDMGGFSLEETGPDEYRKLWFRGGFPRSFLSVNEDDSSRWRENFIRTFLERDIPQLGINIPAVTMRRFWIMLANWNGQLWNGSEFARAMGTSEPTVRRYLDILTQAYMIRQVQPWFANIGKRQVKSPKFFFRDSGLLHTLLSLKSDQILSHPKAGSSWEGFVLEQIYMLYRPQEGFFWATYAGAELDFMFFKEGKPFGIEMKYTDAPATTKSMHIAIDSLGLEKLFILYPGDRRYKLSEKIEAIPVRELVNFF